MDISIIFLQNPLFDEYIHHLGVNMYNELELIGRRIKTLRKEKGWSQQYLAELAGLDRTTIGAMERCDYTDLGIRKVAFVLRLVGQQLTFQQYLLPTLDDLVARQKETFEITPKKSIKRRSS